MQDTVGCGYTLSVMDGKARATAAAHGVTISEMGFVDPFYAYYDSKLLKKRSPHVPLGRLEKDIAEYKKLGVRILGVYPPCLQGEVYENHPDWRRIATNTTEIPQIDMKKYPHGGMLCLLGPYGDFFIDVLAEILTKYPDVDAFSFDGLHYGGVCYCQHCRANYRKDTGAEIPNADMNDPAFRRYQHWADRRMEDLVRRMQTRLKGIKPDVALVTWTTNAGRFGHFLSIPRNMPARMNLLLDAPDQEFWLDETNRGTTIVPAFANAYIWATTNHRVAFSEPYILSHGNPYGKDSFPAARDPAPHAAGADLRRRAQHRRGPARQPPGGTLRLPRRGQAAQAVADAQEARALGGPGHERQHPQLLRPLGRAWSRSATWQRSSAPSGPRSRSTCRVTVINDWNLNAADLARYKVLILPNTACLDDAQVAAVEQFVRDGGGLVASLDTSLFDEFGNPRKNFALGTRPRRRVPWSAGRAAAARRRSTSTSPRPSGRTTGKSARTSSTSSRIPLRSSTRAGCRPTSATRLSPSRAPPCASPRRARRPRYSARCGAGRSPARRSSPASCRQYLRQGPRRLLRGGVRRGILPLCVSLPAPAATPRDRLGGLRRRRRSSSRHRCACIRTLMRQSKDGAERLIVHLFSDLNTTAFHALPNDDVPLREEVVPIHDIRITFDPRYRLRRVHLEPEGTDLKIKKTAGGPSVIVPRLDVHAMVVGELE